MTTQQVALNGGWAAFRQSKSNGDAAKAELTTTDLIDILDTIDVPIVVIDRSFVIASFNRAAAEVLRLEPSDIGRSPRDILMLVGLAQLEEWCAQAMATRAARRHDFRHGDKSFVLRVSSYISSDREIGTVLTFTNVTAFRASIDQAIYEREYTKTILNTIAAPLVVLSPDLRVQAGNRAFYAMFGVSRDQTQGVLLYKLANDAFELDQLRTQLEGTLSDGHAFQPFEMELDLPDLGHRAIILDAHAFNLPRQSRRMILLAFHDITARKQAETTGAYLASIVESSGDAIVSKSLDGIIKSWNKGAERLFGYLAEEMIGKSITILIPQDRPDEEALILERIRHGERVDDYETVRMHKDGSFIDISLSVSPIKDVKGEIVGASKIARDITERKGAQDQQRLLLREMEHRVKNLFSVANSVVALSASSARTPRELTSAVQQRLGALARAHALTLSAPSDGDNRSEVPTGLHALIQTIVSPYDSGTNRRVTVSGSDIPISPSALTSFALLLHEFATNAAKYGALSTTAGSVEIECSEHGDQFALTWKERGGPPVEPPGDREGFGSLLARMTVKKQLSGEIDREWAPEGLTIRLSMVRDRLAAGGNRERATVIKHCGAKPE